MENAAWHLLFQGARDAGITLELEKRNLYEKYGEMLMDWNQRMNLTAIEDMESIAVKHFLDSIAVLPRIPEIQRPGIRLVDVGTGAGFPGVPFKIQQPQLYVLLLDSLAKRIGFLNALLKELDVREGIQTRHDRAEDAARDPVCRECFDIAIARAVAGLPVLAEYCLPFVRVGGLFAAMKGPDAGAEVHLALSALKELGAEVERVDSYYIDKNLGRSLVLIRKKRHTPAYYPRKAGIPARKPL
ncbi:MAG TPA: 16S rRNA (guanine(527)-N(7))-methyltransferase RsmG [Clostridiales bacterium]|nr:16S rRNA (guanine(527)-N(7))-methyltransferase RsmG [Clostridiales bacterium]